MKVPSATSDVPGPILIVISYPQGTGFAVYFLEGTPWTAVPSFSLPEMLFHFAFAAKPPTTV